MNIESQQFKEIFIKATKHYIKSKLRGIYFTIFVVILSCSIAFTCYKFHFMFACGEWTTLTTLFIIILFEDYKYYKFHKKQLKEYEELKNGQ